MIGVTALGLFLTVAGLGGTLKPTLFMVHILVDVGPVIVVLLACLFKGAATYQLTEKHAALLDARIGSSRCLGHIGTWPWRQG